MVPRAHGSWELGLAESDMRMETDGGGGKLKEKRKLAEEEKKEKEGYEEGGNDNWHRGRGRKMWGGVLIVWEKDVNLGMFGM